MSDGGLCGHGGGRLLVWGPGGGQMEIKVPWHIEGLMLDLMGDFVSVGI